MSFSDAAVDAAAAVLVEHGWCMNEAGLFDEPPDVPTLAQLQEALEAAVAVEARHE